MADASNSFTCTRCSKPFTVPKQALDKYPGWVPKVCLRCKDAGSEGKKRQTTQTGRSQTNSQRRRFRATSNRAGEENLQLAEVLQRYADGPHDGVFTDGACVGNPGPGGWGVVQVANGEVLAQHHGHDPQTTNNRMELRALIEAYKLLPETATTTIYSDSKLCVDTINEWAAGWQRRGWRRKGGEIKNLELVQQAYALAQHHPDVTLSWIKAHNGSRWNEYADALATAFLRDVL